MQVYEQEPVVEALRSKGTRLAGLFREVADRHGLSDFVKVSGHPSCLLYATLDGTGEPSQAFRSLFLQETIRRGILMPSLVVSYSHDDDDIDRTVEAVDGALGVYRRAMENGVERYLFGRPSEGVYRAFNKPATG